MRIFCISATVFCRYTNIYMCVSCTYCIFLHALSCSDILYHAYMYIYIYLYGQFLFSISPYLCCVVACALQALAATCTCGNEFVDDTLFCNKCGKRGITKFHHLADQCPGHAKGSIHGTRTLEAVRADKVPFGLKCWPDRM